MNKLFSLTLFLLLLLALFPNRSTAQDELMNWEFDGKDGNEALGIGTTSNPRVSTTAPSGILSRGAGLQPATNSGSFNSTNWSTNATFSSNSTDYLEFSIAPTAGFYLNLSSIDISWVRGMNGPRKLSLTSSVDNHTTAIATQMVGNSNVNAYSFSMLSLPSFNETITFRLYGYDAMQLTGIGRLEGSGDDLVIRGTASRCGILAVGPLEVGCTIGAEDYDPDQEGTKLDIPFTAVPGTMVMVSATTTTGGALEIQVFNPDELGNYFVSIAGVLEGEGYTVTISDGICDYTFTGVLTPSICAMDCAVSFGTPELECADFTEDPDAVTITVPYTGATTMTTLMVDPMLNNTGDNLAAGGDGVLTFADAVEGETYVITLFEGTACASEIVVEIPQDFCETVANRPFINEVLYDNMSDAGNFVEIAVPTDRGLAPEDIRVVLYDEADGTAYDSYTFSQADAGIPSSGFQYYTWMTGLQNGPDGIALLVDGRVVEFLSYEGEFTAQTGPAGGLRSTVIRDAMMNILTLQGNMDPMPDPEGFSLQRIGDCSAPNVSCPDGLVWKKAAATKGALNMNQVLPITLKSFTAFAERETVVLEWITANELDNDYFTVERSADGRDFRPIGRVVGTGSTELETSYRHIDTEPLPGRSYYRLQQVDFDGTTAYYGPIAVDRAGIEVAPVRVYPNPNRFGFVTLEGELQRGTRVRLLDIAGRTLRQWTLEEEQVRRELPLGGLAPGVYFLRLEDGSNLRTVRFVRQ